MMAEIDLAQELAERSDAAIATAVKKFLDEKFTEFDTALAPVTAGLPADRQARQLPDTSNDEVIKTFTVEGLCNYCAVHDFNLRHQTTSRKIKRLRFKNLQFQL